MYTSSLLLFCVAVLCSYATTAAATYSIVASPEVCPDNECDVTIKAFGLTPNTNYTIAVYSDNYWDADMQSYGIAYIGTYDIEPNSTSAKVVIGSMVNMHGMNYSFALFTLPGATKTKTAIRPIPQVTLADTPLAVSNYVVYKNPHQPVFIRLALTGNTDEMLVSFTTSLPGTPTVAYGTTYDALTSTVEGTTDKLFTADDMCAEPATDPTIFFSAGYQHTVLITGLDTNTKYFYAVGLQDKQTSETLHFKSNIGVKKSQRHTALIYGDLGTTMPFHPAGGYACYPAGASIEIAKNLLGISSGKKNKLLLGKNPLFNKLPSASEHTLALHIGDLAYAVGYPVYWEYFMQAISDISSRVPYMVSIGNHEYDYVEQPFNPDWTDYNGDSFGECGVQYSARFKMPEPPTAYPYPLEGPSNTARTALWYTFAQGPMTYVVFSAEHDFTEGSTQYKFIEETLKNIDRTVTPWVLVTSHRPFYTTEAWGPEHNVAADGLRSAIEPLLLKYNVPLYAAGHVHKYERSCLLKGNGECSDDKTGYLHLCVGMAGNAFQLAWEGPNYYSFPEPEWSQFRAYKFGIAQYTVNATQFDWQFVGIDGHVHDSFTLTIGDDLKINTMPQY